jgi:imidazolonepropionase-like amidohydrolase
MRRPRYNSFLEALVPFASGRGPVVFQCNNVEDIGRALKIIQEFKLNGILAGATEAWRAADLLKKNPRPLLVSLDFRAPASSVFRSQGEEVRRKAEAELFPANAAELARLKLPFALTAFGLADPIAFHRNLRAAVKSGLDEAEALRALTITPARILGLERSLGSLEAGKTANIVLTKGRLFDEKTTVAAVFVDGTLFSYSEVTK